MRDVCCERVSVCVMHVVSECVCDVCCERVSVCVHVCCERVSVCVHVCMCVM